MVLNFYHLQVFSKIKQNIANEPCTPDEIELKSIAWRFSDKKLKFYNSKRTVELNSLPVNFKLINIQSYWLKIDIHQPWTLVTQFSIESINNNVDSLKDWITYELDKFKLITSSEITGLEKNNRTSSTICILKPNLLTNVPVFDANNTIEIGIGAYSYTGSLAEVVDTFLITKDAGKHRTGGSIFNEQTILYIFYNILNLKHIISELTSNALPYIENLKSLESPKTRNILLENYRIFISAKVYFSKRFIINYWDYELPIWDYFFENYDLQKDLDDVEKEINGFVDLGTHAAAISSANSSYNTSIAATLIGLIGLIGTLAGIIQAVDNPNEIVPFESRGSILRLFLILGISSILLTLSGIIIIFKNRIASIFNKNNKN